MQTNSVDPDQIADEQSDLGPHCLLQRHFKWISSQRQVSGVNL